MKSNNKYKMKTILILVTALSIGAKAQLPDTDIFLAAMNKSKDGKLTFGKPENITNRKGYDNQPYFTPDGKSILYVSVPDEKKGSDIYKYDLLTHKSIQITKTEESEYSPMITPDNKFISVVRVNMDSTQKMYEIPLNNHGDTKMIKGTDSAGYYCWINDSMLAQFLIRDVNVLQARNIKTGVSRVIASDIGRCLKLSADGRQLYFVLKNNATEWTLMKMNVNTYKLTPVIKTLPGSEDYCILKNGTILMGKESKLFQFNPSVDKDWTEVADFAGSINAFYRITVNAAENKLALVAYTGAKP